MSDRRIRLLYVDDDDALVRLVQRRLGRSGFDVEHSLNGDDALARIQAEPFDVIALDHYLATGTGLDLLSRLASMQEAPAVVYVTGSAAMDIAVAALKAGASDFVPKTVGDDFFVLLESALQQAVDKTRLRKEKEAAERDAHLARERAETLLHEVNHRVANSLALVSSLINLQSKALADQSAKDALSETQSRIYAIALVHKSLYTAGDARFVGVDNYLTGLLEHLRLSTTGSGTHPTLIPRIDSFLVPTDMAISLGVVVTELVTNALKYAYPGDTPVGEIRVVLSRHIGNRIELTISDDGVGWSGAGPIKGTGMGDRIVKAMAKGLNASFEYLSQPKGTTASMLFQLPQQ